jgi:hypothetical protein
MSRFIVFSAIFGPVVFWGLSYFAYTQTEVSRKWVPVQARILDSAVVTKQLPCSKGSSLTCDFYVPEVRYAYEISGQHFESRVIGDSQDPTTNRALAESPVAEFPKGARATAYVNPANLASAVLHKGLEGWTIAVFVGAGLVWAVLWGGIGWLFRDKPAPAPASEIHN